MCHAASIPWVASALLGWLTIAIAGSAPGVTGAAIAGEVATASANCPASTGTAVGPDELGFEEIVFVKRKPYSSDHYYTDINSGTSPDRFLPHNGIYVYNLRTRLGAGRRKGRRHAGRQGLHRQDQPVVRCQEGRSSTSARIPGPDSVSGKWAPTARACAKYRFPPPDEAEKAARWHKGWHTDDIHPCYLPDGKIIFSSTRCEHTVLCGGSAQLVAPGHAPHGRRRRPRRTAYEQPGQRILPAWSSMTAGSCITAGSISTRALGSPRPSGP